MAGSFCRGTAHASIPLARAAAEALFAARAAGDVGAAAAAARYVDVGAAEETCAWAPAEESAAGEIAVVTGAVARAGSAEDN